MARLQYASSEFEPECGLIKTLPRKRRVKQGTTPTSGRTVRSTVSSAFPQRSLGLGASCRGRRRSTSTQQAQQPPDDGLGSNSLNTLKVLRGSGSVTKQHSGSAQKAAASRSRSSFEEARSTKRSNVKGSRRKGRRTRMWTSTAKWTTRARQTPLSRRATSRLEVALTKATSGMAVSCADSFLCATRAMSLLLPKVRNILPRHLAARFAKVAHPPARTPVLQADPPLQQWVSAAPVGPGDGLADGLCEALWFLVGVGAAAGGRPLSANARAQAREDTLCTMFARAYHAKAGPSVAQREKRRRALAARHIASQADVTARVASSLATTGQAGPTQ